MPRNNPNNREIATSPVSLPVILVLTALACATCEPRNGQARPVVLATTTSTADTGLLDVLIPMFERESGFKVKTVAVGSGQALELGRRGEADVLLAHAPEQELAMVAAGHGRRRRSVMYNDFVVVCPPSDPAGIAGGRDAARAMGIIAARAGTWITRGDGSGTHVKELELWRFAGVDPSGDWYVETGQGMGATLRVASERRACTLSDRGTLLATSNLDLQVAVEGDAGLRNPYHVIEVVDPKVNASGAEALADFLVSPPAQRAIAAFEVRGARLFFPDAED